MMIMKNIQTRRTFLSAIGLATAGGLLSGNMYSFGSASPKIKIGQIGTGHAHAYKIGTLRRLTDLFEVVCVADDDPKHRDSD